MGLLLKQKRILAFLIVFVTTTVALPFAALLPSQQVSAATYTDSSIKTEAECKALGGTFTSSYQGSSLETRCSNLPVRIDTEAKIIANAAWLAECFAGSIANQPQYSASEIQDANLLLAGQKVVGHIIARDDGKLDCGDGANVTSKLRAIGYTDMVGALVDIGCRKQGNSGTYDCTNTNSSKTQIYQKFVKKKYSDAGLTDVNKYYIALETFRVGCTASPITSPTEADRNAANSNSGETYNITEVGADGTKTSAIYTSEKDRGDNISTLNGSAGWESDGSFECRTLASMTNSYADAYANWAKNNSILAQQVATAAQAANSGSDAEACAIEGIGWIVCPVASFLAQATDAVYGLVEKLLIFTVQSDSYGAFDSQNPVFLVWSGIRNLANIAFIFAFFMIIFSQATSIGIGNYGIKKMLPRLIVAAILVNLSYYICVFAVDISNILGAGVDGIIESTPLSQIEGPENNWVEIIGSVLSAGTVGVGAVAAAAALSGTSFWAVLASALPFMVTALFAALTALVVLVARQALLIILIVVAPLAFVAYILPNTESFFEKWRKAFTTLLLFYPIVAVVFSGAQVAAAVLRTTRPDDVLIMIASLAVQTFPLFALPFLLKFSGGVLGKIAGVVNNPNKGPFDKLRKRAEVTRDTAQARARANAIAKPRPDYTGKKYARSRNALANANIFSARRNAQAAQDRERALNEAKQAESRAGAEYYAHRVNEDPKYAERMAGGTTGTLGPLGRKADPRALSRINYAADEALVKIQSEETGRALAKMVASGGFSPGSKYTVRDASGSVVVDKKGVPISSVTDPRKLIEYGLRNPGGTLTVENAAGTATEFKASDVRSALLSQTAKMGDIPLTESVIAIDGKTESEMREFITYNIGNYVAKAPDYVKGETAAFGAPPAKELVGWHFSTALRAQTYANADPASAKNIAVSLQQALGNGELRGELNRVAVKNLLYDATTGAESEIYKQLSPADKVDVVNFLATGK